MIRCSYVRREVGRWEVPAIHITIIDNGCKLEVPANNEKVAR